MDSTSVFDMPTRRERFSMHNSLIALVQAMKDHYITVEMRSGNTVSGKLSLVDGYMNVALDDAVMLTADDKQHAFEYFFILARHIKFFSIPKHLLKTVLGGEEPHCLYIGDNVVQDLYTPAQHTRCHTIAVMEELWAESGGHPDEKAITSPLWDSYFGTAAAPSLWHGFLSTSSRLIVPNFETLATLPLKGPIPAGYYPKPPPSHLK